MECIVCHKTMDVEKKITRFWRNKIYQLCSEECASLHLHVINELISKEQTGEINEN